MPDKKPYPCCKHCDPDDRICKASGGHNCSCPDGCDDRVPAPVVEPEQPTLPDDWEPLSVREARRKAALSDTTTNNTFVPCSICSLQWLPERLNDGACEDCHERFIGDGRYVPNHLQIRYRAWKLAERIERETPEAVAGRFPDLATVYADVRYASALGWVDGQEWFTEEHHWRGSDVF